MEFLANILSSVASNLTTDARTPWVFYDEPECPEELI